MRYKSSVALAVAIILMVPAVDALCEGQGDADAQAAQNTTPAASSRQPADEGETEEAETGEPDGSPRQLLQRMFDESSPPVGSPLPDVSAFDADGNELRLGSLKGHWSVIVFGCLT